MVIGKIVMMQLKQLISMLTNIIKNPIDTPYGYKNPDFGIALRGPLSQFFSGIYLKPLDDAFNNMDVTYLRYQDDVLILCNTKRQLNRCKRKMMEVLNKRHLRVSKRKTRMGEIEKSGFHFLGIEYPPTQIEDNTNVTPVLSKKEKDIVSSPDYYLSDEGGGKSIFYSANTGFFTYTAHGSTCANIA